MYFFKVLVLKRRKLVQNLLFVAKVIFICVYIHMYTHIYCFRVWSSWIRFQNVCFGRGRVGPKKSAHGPSLARINHNR